jgi:hypothetical protein
MVTPLLKWYFCDDSELTLGKLLANINPHPMADSLG